MAGNIVNPDNLKEELLSEDPLRYGFPEEVATRVPMLFRRLALYYSILVVAALIFIQDGPQTSHRNEDDYRSTDSVAEDE